MATFSTKRLSLTALLCTGVLVLAGCNSAQESTESPSPSPTVESATATATEHPTASASASPTEKATPSAEPQNTEEAQKTESAIASEQPSQTGQPQTAEPAPTGTVETAPPAPQQTQPGGEPSNQPSASAQSTAPQAAGSGTCTDSQIHIAAQVAEGGGAAGSRYITLTFTNAGDSPCTISGYPGVNYVDESGNQIGSAASHAAEWTSSGKTLVPGESTNATLRETRAGLYDPATCQPQTAAGYRVNIPGTSGSLVLNFPAEACSGGNSQLSVGQVGAGA